MLRGSIRLFRVLGIEIAVHPSWLIIFALVSWSLATGYFPSALVGIATAEAWVLGLFSALLLFGSVLIHELAHSLVARSRGLDAKSITLFIFGGVSTLSGDSPRASTEFFIAVVGPLTSFAISGVAFVVNAALPADSAAGAVTGYLAVVNLLLGGFNLIPGFPLDGGRVFRAIIWKLTGSQQRGTQIAVAVGRLVAYGFFAWGFISVIKGDLGGIWIVFIGWFLENAARSSLAESRLAPLIAGAHVRDFVTPDTTAVDADLTVARLIDEHLLPGNRRAMPVIEDGRLVGMVTLGDIRHLAPELRATTKVRDVMGGHDGLVTVRPGDSLKDALSTVSGGGFEQIPVVEDGRLIGVLTRADLLRQIQLRDALETGGGAKA
ncbi:MAG: site-2 protease family protein [Candidatus Limnocylindrales bacterium]